MERKCQKRTRRTQGGKSSGREAPEKRELLFRKSSYSEGEKKEGTLHGKMQGGTASRPEQMRRGEKKLKGSAGTAVGRRVKHHATIRPKELKKEVSLAEDQKKGGTQGRLGKRGTFEDKSAKKETNAAKGTSSH